MNTDDVQICEWFLLCENPATTTRAHPKGDIPICTRCDDKIERLSGGK